MRKPTRQEMAAEFRARAKAHREARLKEAAALADIRTGNLESIFGRIVLPGEHPSTAPVGSQENIFGVEESQVLTRRWGTGDDVGRPWRCRWGLMRLAFGLGLLLAALTASSLVAWRFGFDPALGTPLVWHLYSPLAVLAWARSWGLDQAYRPQFLSALTLPLLPMMLPFAVLWLRELYGPMRTPERDADEGLGRPADLLKAGHVGRRPPGVVIGRDRKGVIRDQGDGHVLIMGATRSGKGRGHVVPTLLSHPGSVLAFDPKGELAAIAGRRRALLGPLFVIDPTQRWSAGFNPLLELDDGERLHGDCRMAADLLMAGGGTSHERFWEEAAGNLAFALLVHVRQSAEPTLAHLWRLAAGLEAGRYPASGDPFVAPVLEGLRRLDQRIRGSILTTLTTRLAFLGDPVAPGGHQHQQLPRR